MMHDKHVNDKVAVIVTNTLDPITDELEISLNMAVRSLCPELEDVYFCGLDLGELVATRDLLAEDGYDVPDTNLTGMRIFFLNIVDGQFQFAYITPKQMENFTESLILEERYNDLHFDDGQMH